MHPFTFACGEPAFGTDQEGSGRLRAAPEDFERRPTGAGLVGKDQAAGFVPIRQKRLQGLRLVTCGNAQTPTLLGGFARPFVDLVAPHLRPAGELGRDRQQGGDAEFGRLFHQEAQPLLLERREDQPNVGVASLCLDHALSARPCPFEHGEPFAVAAVEQSHVIALRQAHDTCQVVTLCLGKWHVAPGREVDVEEKAWNRSSVDAQHGG